jgi:hypothetical protein
MAFRTTAVMAAQSSTVPQPLVGSWITAGIGLASAAPIVVTLGTQTVAPNVDASAIFRAQGDHALLVDVDGSDVEDVMITAVSGNTVTLGVQNQTGVATRFNHTSGAFGTGTFILLHGLANNLYVQMQDGATGPDYIGNAWNMTAAFRRIVKLKGIAAGAQPLDYSATMNFFGNPFDMSELWFLGTITDQYNPVFTIV